MSKLFLSYRRSDRYAAGLLRAEIVRRLGSSRVFMDTRNLRAGDEFPALTDSAVSEAGVALVLIGDGWIAEQDRLADADDWVRRELELAIRGGARVVPVLLDDAELPAAHSLPESIRGLADAQAYRITTDHLDRDVGDLLDTLGEHRRRGPLVAAALALVFAAFLGAFVLWPSDEGETLSFLNTQLVFDASSGMQDVIPTEDGGAKAKSDVAEEQVREYVETREGDKLALRVADSCGSPGTLVVPFKTDASGDILESLANTSYTGDDFPLAAAIVAATADFNDPEQFPADAVSKQIIVFTTSGGTCETDPGAVLEERWDELGDIRLKLELIGLGIEEGTDEADELRRTAASVDGRAFPVTTAEELDEVLRALLEVEPVQLAAEEISSVGNSIVEPLQDLRRAHNACDAEAAATATEAARARADAAEPALDALEGREDFEAFAAVHEGGAAWAESLSNVIPAGEELTDQIEGATGEDECDELSSSDDDWAAAVEVWNEAVDEANAALSALDDESDALRGELEAILQG